MAIGFNVAPPHPTLPPWMYILILVQDGTGAGSPVMFLPYAPSADPQVGDDPVVYLQDFASAWSGPLGAWWPVGVNGIEIGFYWETALGTQRWRYGAGIAPPLPGGVSGWHLPGAMQGLVWKRSSTQAKAVGRLWVPFVPEAMWGGGDFLNHTGSVALDSIAQMLITDITSQGVTFVPSSYLRAADIMDPVVEVKSGPKLFNLMRRAGHRGNQNNSISIQAFNWDY
jgi:hypothetical protein